MTPHARKSAKFEFLFANTTALARNQGYLGDCLMKKNKSRKSRDTVRLSHQRVKKKLKLKRYRMKFSALTTIFSAMVCAHLKESTATDSPAFSQQMAL
jgi:hypothetical protein